jgi:hypothetical protein
MGMDNIITKQYKLPSLSEQYLILKGSELGVGRIYFLDGGNLKEEVINTAETTLDDVYESLGIPSEIDTGWSFSMDIVDDKE